MSKSADVWLVRNYGEVELFTGKKAPNKDEFCWATTEPLWGFCDTEFRRMFGFLGLREGRAPKRFRITIEEITDEDVTVDNRAAGRVSR